MVKDGRHSANPLSINPWTLSTGASCARYIFNEVQNRGRSDLVMFPPELDRKLKYYGKLETEIIIPEMTRQGWNILGKQTRCSYMKDGQKMVSGKIDAIAVPPGFSRPMLVEIKTANETLMDNTNSLLDLCYNDKYYYRGQVAQLFLYGLSEPEGFGFCKDTLALVQFCRDSGEIKTHFGSLVEKPDNDPDGKLKALYDPAYLDFADQVIKTVEIAWDGLLKGVAPKYCPDLSICQDCFWQKEKICDPPLICEGVNVELFGIAEELVVRYLELKESRTEADRLQKAIETRIKDFIKARDFKAPAEGFLIGDGRFHVTAAVSPRKGYVVEPTHMIKLAYRDIGDPDKNGP